MAWLQCLWSINIQRILKKQRQMNCMACLLVLRSSSTFLMGFCFPESLFLLNKSDILIKKFINCGSSLNVSISKQHLTLPCSRPWINIYFMKTWTISSQCIKLKTTFDAAMFPASVQYLSYGDLGLFRQGEKYVQSIKHIRHVCPLPQFYIYHIKTRISFGTAKSALRHAILSAMFFSEQHSLICTL